MQTLSDPIWVVVVLISPFLFIPPRVVSQDSEEVPATGKRRRQVFREDVSPLLGGKVPSAAFDWTRLMFNNLDSRGISIPDGTYPSSDRNGDGRNDENRLMLFSSDGLTSNIPSTYTLRNPVKYPLYPNPDEKPLDEGEFQSNDYGCSSDQCHLYGYDKVTRSNYDEPQSQKPFLNNNEPDIPPNINGEEEEAHFPLLKNHHHFYHSQHQRHFPFLFNKYQHTPMEIHVFQPSPFESSSNGRYSSSSSPPHNHPLHPHISPTITMDHILFHLKKSTLESAHIPAYFLITSSNSQSTHQMPKNKFANGKSPVLSMKSFLREVLRLEKFSK